MLKRFKVIALIFCLLTVGASAIVNSQGTMATWSNVTNTTPSVITAGNLDFEFYWSGPDPYWKRGLSNVDNRVLQGEELQLVLPFSARVKGNNLKAVIETEMLDSSGKVMTETNSYNATWQLFTNNDIAVGGAFPMNSSKRDLSPALISTLPNAAETGKIVFRISIDSGAPVGTTFPATIRTTVSQDFGSNKITGITASASSEETQESYPNGRALALVDGNPNTFWHTQWAGAAPDYPHIVTLTLPGNYNIDKVVFTPRQGSTNGQIKDGSLYCKKASDPDFTLVSYFSVAAGFGTTSAKLDCEGSQMRFYFYNSQNYGDIWASLGEIEVYGAKL